MVDRADLALLQPLDVAARVGRARQPPPHLGEAGHGPAGQDPAALADLLDGPDQEAPFGPLDDDHVRRVVAPGNLGLVHPLEIGAVEVAVGDLQLHPILPGLGGHRLAVDQLARQRLAVA